VLTLYFYISAAVYLALKASNVVSRGDPGSAVTLDLMRSGIFFNLGYALFWGYRFLLDPCAFVYILGYILERAMLEASFYGLGAFGRSVGRVVCISDLIEVLSHFTA
jgi:hypothetical protein